MKKGLASETLEQWLIRLKRHESEIFVREKVDGVWGAVALSDLEPERWGKHVARWLEDGTVPVYLRDGTP